MTPLTHHALYRNGPLILGGLLGAIALLIAGVLAAMQVATTGDELLPLVLGALGLFVAVFATCMLAALRRHRWTIDAQAVLIEERPLVPLTGRRRLRRVPFGAIRSLGTVQNTADDLLSLTTRAGERFVLPPGLEPGNASIRRPDQVALGAFAARLQTAMAAAGHAPPSIAQDLGYWNRAPGLALLGVGLAASLALAVVTLWGLWEGAASRHRGGEAAALVVMLPVGLAWMLRRSWRRRRAAPQRARPVAPSGTS